MIPRWVELAGRFRSARTSERQVRLLQGRVAVRLHVTTVDQERIKDGYTRAVQESDGYRTV